MATPILGADTEQWDIFELALDGPADGNPFLDVSFGASFQHGHRSVEVDGFYDGDGVYRVRFMPDVQGEWRYRTHSSAPELDGREGGFACIAPSAGNHGPVHVARHLSLRLCRRHALQPDRHDLLCVESPRRRAGGADAGDAGGCALQQDAHVRLSQALPLQPERAGPYLSLRGRSR